MTRRTAQAALSAVIAAIFFATPAFADIEPAIRDALMRAKTLMTSGDYNGALVSIRNAEGVPNKTPEETKMIEAMKTYFLLKQSDPQSLVVNRTKAKACGRTPRAATWQEAEKIYEAVITLDQPVRIRTLRRPDYWLVFQGEIIPGLGENNYPLKPMDGARHIVKVSRCDGSIRPF